MEAKSSTPFTALGTEINLKMFFLENAYKDASELPAFIWFENF